MLTAVWSVLTPAQRSFLLAMVLCEQPAQFDQISTELGRSALHTEDSRNDYFVRILHIRQDLILDLTLGQSTVTIVVATI